MEKIPLLLKACMLLLMFTFFSCQDEPQIQEATPSVPESTLMSLEEAQRIVDDINLSSANGRVQLETREYDFAATYSYGTQKGSSIIGKLTLSLGNSLGFYQPGEGNLVLSETTSIKVKGIFLSDGTAYLFFNTSPRIIGIGKADDKGNFVGNFYQGASGGMWVASLAEVEEPEPLKSIVEIAVTDERFTTLVQALTAANLVGTLSGEGPFTVFAPTNDAFAALESLPEGDVLKQVLLYHVVSGSFSSSDLAKLKSIKTIQGKDVTIEVTQSGIILNGEVNVIIKDIHASNGIIHVIDAVLIPPADGKEVKVFTYDVNLKDKFSSQELKGKLKFVVEFMADGSTKIVDGSLTAKTTDQYANFFIGQPIPLMEATINEFRKKVGEDDFIFAQFATSSEGQTVSFTLNAKGTFEKGFKGPYVASIKYLVKYFAGNFTAKLSDDLL